MNLSDIVVVDEGIFKLYTTCRLENQSLEQRNVIIEKKLKLGGLLDTNLAKILGKNQKLYESCEMRFNPEMTKLYKLF